MDDEIFIEPSFVKKPNPVSHDQSPMRAQESRVEQNSGPSQESNKQTLAETMREHKVFVFVFAVIIILLIIIILWIMFSDDKKTDQNNPANTQSLKSAPKHYSSAANIPNNVQHSSTANTSNNVQHSSAANTQNNVPQSSTANTSNNVPQSSTADPSNELPKPAITKTTEIKILLLTKVS